MAADDPFHHLHDEGYAARYASRPVGADKLVAIAGRAVEPLHAGWRLTLDLFDEGLRQNWPALDDAPSSQWATPRDYTMEAGELVDIPSCWTMLKPEWRYFEGAAWYGRDLDLDPKPGERLILHLGAANYAALVFLNGALVGSHRGGSTPFCIELTAAARQGRNRLHIMVENRRQPDRVPMSHFDWFNHGGLYREVSLLRLPPVFIRQISAGLAPGAPGRVALALTLSDPIDGVAEASIEELGLRVAIPIVAGRGRIEIDAAPVRWSCDAPKLYDVVFQFRTDEARERVGFRTVQTRGHDILLNGEPIFLKGVCVHEDDAALGKVSDEADIRRRLDHARELGCNFLRLAHYPHHDLVARIADELGLLLWAEIPVYWAIDFANPETYADAENQLLELIARDGNRASVILWGVGNENADTDERLAFMSRLARAAKAADPSRLVTAACLIDRERFAIADRLATHLDVIGLNQYFGWYEPDFAGLERLIANSAPEKPVIVSETGADAEPGLHAEGRRLFSEDWQARFLQEQFRRLLPTPWVRGVAVWLLYDFRSERRQTAHQRGFNRKGLIAEDKATKKRAFAALAAIYGRISLVSRKPAAGHGP
jgi:beta-glucuronidase